jgi:hypothetical protein
MTSERKIQANRRNAQRSTGPRSRKGKRRVSKNALRHGLATRILDDPEKLVQVEQLVRALAPEGRPDRLQLARIVAEAEFGSDSGTNRAQEPASSGGSTSVSCPLKNGH